MSNVRSMYWCFTYNNYTPADKASLSEFFEAHCTYATYGHEVGEEGTPHLQGYFELSSRWRFDKLKRTLTSCGLREMHFEPRNGSAQKASDYCHKEGVEPGFFFGEISISTQGARTDLDALRDDLIERKPLADIAQNHFGSFLRYQRGILAFRNVVAEQRMWEVDVRVLWGLTGTGKTKKVYAECELNDLYSHPGGPWFDGYDGQHEVLFDEFSGSYFALPYLLKLLDRYPMSVPIKGGFVAFVPRRIWITSNYPPDAWYPNAKEEHVNALLRRLSSVQEYE